MDKNYYPPKPNFKALTSAGREKMFGKFRYEPTGNGNIRILGNWVKENIVKVKIPQLIGVFGAPKDGVIYFHKKGVEQIKGFFQAVEDAGLLHLIISWAGSYNARFIRGSSASLSNHSWATAFDINAPENWLGQKPAAIGKKGSLLQIVKIAHQFGFYWGGHFDRLDGMHFELAVLDKFPASTAKPLVATKTNPTEKPALIPVESAESSETAVITSPENSEWTEGEKPTESTATATIQTVQGEIKQEIASKNEQNVNEPAAVAEPAPQGVFAKLTGGITALFSGTLVYTIAEKFGAISISQTVLILLIVVVIIGFLGFCFWAALDAYKANQKVKYEVESKTAIDKKDIEWVKPN